MIFVETLVYMMWGEKHRFVLCVHAQFFFFLES